MKTKTPSKEPNFEDSLERLEGLVQEMESGDLPLEDILKKYEEGNKLIKLCATKLNEAEKRIEILMNQKDGSLGIKKFDLEETEIHADDHVKEENKGRTIRGDKSPQEDDLF